MIVEPGDGERPENVLVAAPATTVFGDRKVLLLLGQIANLNRFSTLYHG